MRYLALIAVTILSLAAPGLAAASGPLSYNLQLHGIYYSGVRPSGTITGTLGGVGVAGAYEGGVWSLMAYGRRFASGTYTCLRECTFTGVMLAGRSVAYTLPSHVPTWDAPTVAASGHVFIGGLSARGAWVSAVSAWANANGFGPTLRSRIVMDATTGM